MGHYTSHAGVELKLTPDSDGVTFHLGGAFIAPLPPKPPVAAKDKPPPVRLITPERAANGTHADGAVRFACITGPVVQIAPDTFRVAYNRACGRGNLWSSDIWLVAYHPGDAAYKTAVQQAVLKLPRHESGKEQHIAFAPIPDQSAGATDVKLRLESDAGLPVFAYVREGPAEIVGDTLHVTAIPVRAKRPVAVTVVAWQMGDANTKAARPVERTFMVGR